MLNFYRGKGLTYYLWFVFDKITWKKKKLKKGSVATSTKKRGLARQSWPCGHYNKPGVAAKPLVSSIEVATRGGATLLFLFFFSFYK